MSYQVLARKWRPKNFQQLMGQEHVVTVLTNAISQQRLHHAYLFTGTRGVGKTTIARIFAKSLNCQLGITAEPCGQCEACVDIDQGRFVDLLEIDAASRTKVDDTREILDNVQYAPTRGRYKVYLIDEVHMLSRSSFNALLKTLEEPPEHVKFILATTDPQKLPVTVLSRCLQFHLKALTVTQIAQQLEIILAAEHVQFEPLAVNLLAKAARGSMRDSLSLTDQAIAQGQGNIQVANVQQMLGGVDHNWVYKILIALIKQDAQGLMQLSKEIASYAPNYGRLLAELIQLLHQIAMTQVVESHFDLSPEHNLLLEKFCQSMSPEDVQLYYQIALTGRKDLPYAADEQAAFDMVLLRLLAFKAAARPQDDAKNASSEASVVDFDDIKIAETNINESNEGLVQAIISAPIADQASKTDAESQLPTQEQLTEEMLAIEQQAEQVLDDSKLSFTVGTETETETAPLPLVEHQVATQQANDVADVLNPVIAEPAAEVSDNTSSQLEPEPQQLQHEPVTKQSLDNQAGTQIDSVLASRNMLRSRKKALEQNAKKSKDADERPQDTKQAQANKQPVNDAPAIETLPEQPFTPEIIDPSKVKKANQVDKWANMIDTMALNGRLRQLALNATIDSSSSSESLVLLLNQATKHLKSDAAHQQLQQFVSDYFQRPMQVEIRIVEQTVDDPSQIQGHINDKRYLYAKELLLKDDVVMALQQKFQAELDEKTIVAR